MIKLSNFTKGFLGIVLAQVCWSTIEIVGTLAYKSGISSLTLLNVRFITALLCMFFTLLVFNRKLFRFEKKDLKTLFALNAILLVHLVAFWQGIKTLNHVPTAVGIYFTFPCWIVIFSRLFLKEAISARKKASLVLGTAGSVLLIKVFSFSSISQINFLGVGLMFLAAAMWAAYAMVGRSMFKKYSPLTILFYNFLFMAVVVNLLQSPSVTLGQLNSQVMPYLLFMGVITTYLAYILFYWGLKFIKSSTAGVLALTKPFISGVLCYLILKQYLTLGQLVGMGLILSGTYLISEEKK